MSITKFDNTQVPANYLDDPLPPVPYTAMIQDHTTDLIHHDLPGWNLAVNPGTPNQPVVDAVNNLAAELVRGRQEEVTRPTASTKTPEQYFGNSILTLYRYTHTETQESLPQLYAKVSNTTKKTYVL